MSDLLNAPLSEVDPTISRAIDDEVRRQAEGLELIASENFVSEAVLEAMGSVFTNKYAEGYPGKRYYGGCEFTDIVEKLARERGKKIFGAEHANVQPHSRAQAQAHRRRRQRLSAHPRLPAVSQNCGFRRSYLPGGHGAFFRARSRRPS